MQRPRWHDGLIALAIAVIAAAGVWAYWGDELLGAKRAPAAANADPSAT